MKNLTITVDDETYRAGRIKAAELGTSLSALVKQYLQQLADVQSSPGVSEMPMAFKAQPSQPKAEQLPPRAYGRFTDGTPYYTPDGKPRQPGAMRGTYGKTNGLDEWPPEIIAFFDKLQSDPFDGDSFDPLP